MRLDRFSFYVYNFLYTLMLIGLFLWRDAPGQTVQDQEARFTAAIGSAAVLGALVLAVIIARLLLR